MRGCGSLALGARRLSLLRRYRQEARRVHERHVRQGLRKIAEHALGARIVFFREEPHIVAQLRATARTTLRLRRGVRSAGRRPRAKMSTARTRPRPPAARRRPFRSNIAARVPHTSAPARSRQSCRERAHRRAAESPPGESTADSRRDPTIHRIARRHSASHRSLARTPRHGWHRALLAIARPARPDRRVRHP